MTCRRKNGKWRRERYIKRGRERQDKERDVEKEKMGKL